MVIISQADEAPQEALNAMGISRNVDELESAMTDIPPVECPVNHVFTKGLYTRTIFMPAGTLIVSKLHKTQHPYFVLKGKATVWTETNGVVEIEAPFVGITEPGTRRVLYIHSDCIWATAHANPDDETVDQIEARIIEPRPILIEETKPEEICQPA